MPIRLNLLAEAQAAEEARRRDPVKRAIWIGSLLVALMLAWSSSLQLKAMLAKNDLSRIQGAMNAITNDYQQVLDNQKMVSDFSYKLAALHQLTTNRLLNGTLLDALQKTTRDDVQLMHLRVTQEYIVIEETKARTNANRVTPAKPGSSTEKITLTLDCSDSSINAGEQVLKFKELLANNEYFQMMLGKTNEVILKNQGAPQVNPEHGKPTVMFTLECRYPERKR
jgi:hypothetical protein